jgi:hypothetical protein
VKLVAATYQNDLPEIGGSSFCFQKLREHFVFVIFISILGRFIVQQNVCTFKAELLLLKQE